MEVGPLLEEIWETYAQLGRRRPGVPDRHAAKDAQKRQSLLEKFLALYIAHSMESEEEYSLSAVKSITSQLSQVLLSDIVRVSSSAKNDDDSAPLQNYLLHGRGWKLLYAMQRAGFQGLYSGRDLCNTLVTLLPWCLQMEPAVIPSPAEKLFPEDDELPSISSCFHLVQKLSQLKPLGCPRNLRHTYSPDTGVQMQGAGPSSGPQRRRCFTKTMSTAASQHPHLARQAADSEDDEERTFLHHRSRSKRGAFSSGILRAAPGEDDDSDLEGDSSDRFPNAPSDQQDIGAVGVVRLILDILLDLCLLDLKQSVPNKMLSSRILPNLLEVLHTLSSPHADPEVDTGQPDGQADDRQQSSGQPTTWPSQARTLVHRQLVRLILTVGGIISTIPHGVKIILSHKVVSCLVESLRDLDLAGPLSPSQHRLVEDVACGLLLMTDVAYRHLPFNPLYIRSASALLEQFSSTGGFRLLSFLIQTMDRLHTAKAQHHGLQSQTARDEVCGDVSVGSDFQCLESSSGSADSGLTDASRLACKCSGKSQESVTDPGSQCARSNSENRQGDSCDDVQKVPELCSQASDVDSSPPAPVEKTLSSGIVPDLSSADQPTTTPKTKEEEVNFNFDHISGLACDHQALEEPVRCLGYILYTLKTVKVNYIHAMKCLKRRHRNCEYGTYFDHHHDILGQPRGAKTPTSPTQPTRETPEGALRDSRTPISCQVAFLSTYLLELMPLLRSKVVLVQLLSTLRSVGMCCCTPPSQVVGAMLPRLPHLSPALRNYCLQTLNSILLTQLQGGAESTAKKSGNSLPSCTVCSFEPKISHEAAVPDPSQSLDSQVPAKSIDSGFSSSDVLEARKQVQLQRWRCLLQFCQPLKSADTGTALAVSKHLISLAINGNSFIKEELFFSIYHPMVSAAALESQEGRIKDIATGDDLLQSNIPSVTLVYSVSALPYVLQVDRVLSSFLQRGGLEMLCRLLEVDSLRAPVMLVFEALVMIDDAKAREEGRHPSSDPQGLSHGYSGGSVIQMFLDILAKKTCAVTTAFQRIQIKQGYTEPTPDKQDGQRTGGDSLSSGGSQKEQHVATPASTGAASECHPGDGKPSVAEDVGATASPCGAWKGCCNQDLVGKMPVLLDMWRTCAKLCMNSSTFQRMYPSSPCLYIVKETLLLALQLLGDSTAESGGEGEPGGASDVGKFFCYSNKLAFIESVMVVCFACRSITPLQKSGPEEDTWRRLCSVLQQCVSLEPSRLKAVLEMLLNVAMPLMPSILEYSYGQIVAMLNLKDDDLEDEDEIRDLLSVGNEDDADSFFPTENGYDADMESDPGKDCVHGEMQLTPSSAELAFSDWDEVTSVSPGGDASLTFATWTDLETEGRASPAWRSCCGCFPMALHLCMEVVVSCHSSPNSQAVVVPTLLRLLQMLRNSRQALPAVCAEGLLELLLNGFRDILTKSTSDSYELTLRQVLLSVTQLLAQCEISARELRLFLRLLPDASSVDSLLSILLGIVEHSQRQPHFTLTFPAPCHGQAPLGEGDGIPMGAESATQRVWRVAALRGSIKSGLVWPPFQSGFSATLWLKLSDPDGPNTCSQPSLHDRYGSLVFSTSNGHIGSEDITSQKSSRTSLNECLHVFSVGTPEKLLEVWIQVRTRALLFRLTSMAAEESELLGEALWEGVLSPVKWQHLVVTYKEDLEGSTFMGKLTVILDGWLKRETILDHPTTFLKNMSNCNPHLCIGHITEDMRIQSKECWEMGPFMFFKGTGLSEEWWFHQFALGMNCTTIAKCDCLEQQTIYSPFINKDIVCSSSLKHDFLVGSSLVPDKDLARRSHLLSCLPQHPGVFLVQRYVPGASPGSSAKTSESSLGMLPSEGEESLLCQSPRCQPTVLLAHLQPAQHSSLERAIEQIGGIGAFLFLVAKVYEDSGKAEREDAAVRRLQSKAVSVLFSLVQHLPLLAEDFLTMAGHNMLARVLTSTRSHTSQDLLKVLLDASTTESLFRPDLSEGQLCLRLGTEAVVRDVHIIKHLLLNWRIWERAKPSVTTILFAALASLVRADHPHREFNIKQFLVGTVLSRILYIYLERIQEGLPPLTMEVSLHAGSIIQSLLGKPPDVHLLVTVTDFLLLVHPAASTFVSDSTSTLYFHLHWTKRSTLGQSGNISELSQSSNFQRQLLHSTASTQGASLSQTTGDSDTGWNSQASDVSTPASQRKELVQSISRSDSGQMADLDMSAGSLEDVRCSSLRLNRGTSASPTQLSSFSSEEGGEKKPEEGTKGKGGKFRKSLIRGMFPQLDSHAGVEQGEAEGESGGPAESLPSPQSLEAVSATPTEDVPPESGTDRISQSSSVSTGRLPQDGARGGESASDEAWETSPSPSSLGESERYQGTDRGFEEEQSNQPKPDDGLSLLCHSLVEYLSQAVEEMSEDLLTSVLGKVISPACLITLCQDTSASMTSSLIKLLTVYLRRAPESAVGEFLKVEGFQLLGAQFHPHITTADQLEAAFSLILARPFSFSSRTRLADIGELSPLQHAAFALVLSLVQRTTHDLALCHNTLDFLAEMLNHFDTLTTVLLDLGLPEALSNLTNTILHLEKKTTDLDGIAENEMLLEDIQRILCIVAVREFSWTGDVHYHQMEDLFNILKAQEDIEFREEECHPKCLQTLRALQFAMVVKTLEYIERVCEQQQHLHCRQQQTSIFGSLTHNSYSGYVPSPSLHVIVPASKKCNHPQLATSTASPLSLQHHLLHQQRHRHPAEHQDWLPLSSGHGSALLGGLEPLLPVVSEVPAFPDLPYVSRSDRPSLMGLVDSGSFAEVWMPGVAARGDSWAGSRAKLKLSGRGKKLLYSQINQSDLISRFKKFIALATDLVVLIERKCVERPTSERPVDQYFSTSQQRHSLEDRFFIWIFSVLYRAMEMSIEKGGAGKPQPSVIFSKAKDAIRTQFGRLFVCMMSPYVSLEMRNYALSFVMGEARGRDVVKLLISTQQVGLELSQHVYNLMSQWRSWLPPSVWEFGCKLINLLRQSNHSVPSLEATLSPAQQTQLTEEKNQVATLWTRNKKIWLLRKQAAADRMQQRFDTLRRRVQEQAMTMTRSISKLQNQHRQTLVEHIKKSMTEQIQLKKSWQELVQGLTHERAVWYNEQAYPQSWQLDPTEGPERMRKRLQRCHLGLKQRFLAPCARNKLEAEKLDPPLIYLFEDDHHVSDSAALLYRLYSNEKIQVTGRCTAVSPNNESKGELLVGELYIFFVADEAITDVNYTQALLGNKDQLSMTWPHCDIKEVHKRWYMLQDVGLEIFLVSGKTHLLAFQNTNERDKMYSVVISLELPSLVMSEDLEQVQKWWRDGLLTNYTYLVYLNKVAGRTFNDLMQYPVFPFVLCDYTSDMLNLADPASYRNLAKPIAVQNKAKEKKYQETYEMLQQEYRKLEAEGSEESLRVMPFHYGSHYSNSGTVLHFLVRLPPFTQMFLKYQDNNFDIPDRTFHSLSTSWRLSSSESSTDVKELIPEFFFLPEFLKNNEGFDFGLRQMGDVVWDVSLPPWCQGSARLFTLVHRQALESPQVSQNLNHWIDLVFGFKQSGEAAIKAINVFHPSTYFGMDVTSIKDPVKRQALITMIRTYGQTPKQLFRHPHPSISTGQQSVLAQFLSPGSERDERKRLYARSPLSSVVGLVWGDYVGSLEYPPPTVSHTMACRYPVSTLVPLPENTVFGLPRNATVMLLYAKEKDVMSWYAMNLLWAGVLRWGYPDGVLRSNNQSSGPLINVLPHSPYDQITCCISLADCRLLFTAGTAGVINVYHTTHNAAKASKLQVFGLKRVLYGHSGPVTVMCVSKPFSILVSASQDGTCIIWDLNRLSYVRSILSHNRPVEVLAVSNTLGDIVSASPLAMGSCLQLHSVNADFIASQEVDETVHCLTYSAAPEGQSVNVIAGGLSTGAIRFWSSWDLTPLRDITHDLFLAKPVISVAFTLDSQHLCAAVADGTVVIWDKLPSKPSTVSFVDFPSDGSSTVG